MVTLQGKLLVVGGRDKSTDKETNTIFTFDKYYRRWIQSHPAMPTAVSFPAVVGYQDHLIVAGGWNTKNTTIPDVNVLDTTSNNWKTAQPLHNTDDYHTVLIEDTMYLVGHAADSSCTTSTCAHPHIWSQV